MDKKMAKDKSLQEIRNTPLSPVGERLYNELKRKRFISASQARHNQNGLNELLDRAWIKFATKDGLEGYEWT